MHRGCDALDQIPSAAALLGSCGEKEGERYHSSELPTSEAAEKQGLRIYRLDNANSDVINRFSSALAIYLNQGKTIGSVGDVRRISWILNWPPGRVISRVAASELYNQFISQVNNFCRTYSDVHFYADQLNVSGRYQRRLPAASPARRRRQSSMNTS